MTAPKTTTKAKAKDEAADEAVDKAQGELCELCWPNGWPTPDTHSACCEHGQWSR